MKNVVCVLEYIPDEAQLVRIKTGESIKGIQHEDFLQEFLSDSASSAEIDAASPTLDDDVRRTLSKAHKVGCACTSCVCGV